MDTPAVAAAKQFFLAALEDQAIRDSVPFSDTERTLFLFSETSASEQAAALVQEIELADRNDGYEARIANLLRRAHRRDRKVPLRAALWRESLQALKGEDFYGMVMLEQAGLRLPGEGAGALKAVVDMLPLTALLLLFAVPFVLLCLDPFDWHLIKDDWLRVLLFVALALGLWLTSLVIPDRWHRSRPW